MKDYDILVIGDTNTGKTSLIRMYIDGKFLDNHHPTPMPILSTKKFTSRSGPFMLKIWDTAGSEGWQTMNSGVYSKSDVVVYLVATDNLESLDHVTSEWKRRLDDYIDETQYKSFIVVNKIDISKDLHQITEEMIQEKAASLNAEVCYISAKENIGVNDMFNKVACAAHHIELTDLNGGPEKEEEETKCCRVF